ncbi:MAG TPA: 2-C-methyl-D-erythritol 2,4-cyclodiphosphate synthase [Chitinophagales bacterium]|nr:2-C-methyl-D-erythritol 2,4-cyclodiphosphate synthase [Chitinophagales bacterium]
MTPNFRIGFGFDVHRLKRGRKFILGGIEIPNEKGPVGHSDADVLIHAICDALLGAAGLRDIGFCFPNTDQQFKNIDSTLLLKKVCDLLKEKKISIGNIDATVVLEQPKVNPHTDAIKKKLSEVMSISTDQISIKATTNERMGFIGKEKGVAAYAVALIFSRDASD